MTGPSERAVEAAVYHLTEEGISAADPTGGVKWDYDLTPIEATRRILAAAHDPALGGDAYVRLGDVLDALREYRPVLLGIREPHSPWTGAAAYLERLHREGRL